MTQNLNILRKKHIDILIYNDALFNYYFIKVFKK